MLTRKAKSNNWRHSLEYAKWRLAVLTRDKFRCTKCGRKTDILISDHIKPADMFPELRFKEANGRTLCRRCHGILGNKAYKLPLKQNESQPIISAKVNKNRVFTVKEMAKEFRVTYKTVYRWIDKGILKAARIGRSLRISEDEFNRLTGKGR